MLTRVKQVIAAFSARIYPEDKLFVETHLNHDEQALFWAMNLPDQRHALNVAYSAIRLANDDGKINQKLLIQCALLHDVGKVRGDVSTLDKIITVAAHKLAPRWAKNWGKEGRGGKVNNLRHAFYTYFNHPMRSVALLQRIGVSNEVIGIIAKHHKAPTENDPPELIILQKADNMH
ncbi:HDIG domain-containing protein [bacterium BFN5]|nr:HDIG domain-containing protein [bacterium BFN5]QJW44530.1 HDIG domain-containing protein [bacterium BFN5]